MSAASNGTDPGRPSAGAPAIETRALAKHFGEVRALDGIDLEVEQGAVFGFLGPNGAGKSTTIRILVDLIRPTSGRASILGFDTQRQTVEAHRRLGYLPDDAQLYRDMTAAEYFRYVDRLRGGAVDVALRDRLASELQLDTERRIGTLSRGNRQKVGMVQALMTRPDVVILDEPTTGLDPLMQEVVEDALREVAADGRTVFFSSHLLAEVEQVCTRVAILRDGRIVDVLDLAEQRRLLPRRVTVTFATPPTNGSFERLPGITLRERTGVRVVFETSGSVDPLIKALAAHTVEAIESHEATLEDLFLSYYGAQPAPAGAAPPEETRADG